MELIELGDLLTLGSAAAGAAFVLKALGITETVYIDPEDYEGVPPVQLSWEDGKAVIRLQ